MAAPETSISLQQQARALGEPTRHAIFRRVADAARPVDVAELTQFTGLHHNAVRQHLAKLVEAGLLTERSAHRAGPGRPRLCYEVRASAESRWGIAGSYEQLALMLTEIIRTGDTPEEVGRRAGRRLGSSHTVGSGGTASSGSSGQAGAASSDPVGDMVAEMARAGFEPSVERRAQHVDVTLQTCAFASTAASDPATVCELHLGIAQGVAETVGGIVIDELVVSDPGAGICHLRCHVACDEPSVP